jgi:pimeloyl-ACP methyl ester carboxylesterase
MERPLVTRRRLLLGGLGLGLIGASAGAGVITDVLPGPPTLRRAVGTTGPQAAVPEVPIGRVTVDRVYSPARDRDINLVIMRPAGISAAPLPVCLVLHGRGGDARGYLDFGLPQFLTAAVRSGVAPFAAVAVDCGKTYLMDRDGDNPMRMLLSDLPGWLKERNLPTPQAVLGFSMGGFGALNYARGRKNLSAVALASPAMFQHWPDAKKRNSFRDEAQWLEFEPLHHTEDFATTPIGLWCGTDDPFVNADREFIANTHPEVPAISKGAHNSAYWLRVLPDIMRFIGNHLMHAAQ